MNKDLAPTYQRLFGPYYLLWFTKSNNYSVVDIEFKQLLDSYIQSDSLSEFYTCIAELSDNKSDFSKISKNIESYLRNCNSIEPSHKVKKPKHKDINQKISACYHIKDKSILVNFDSDLVKKTIHPSLAHLETKQKSKPKYIFDVFLEDDYLCLFKNNELVISVPKRDYHLLQGTFIMQLFSIIHQKELTDWLGTFHGSTISDGHNAILLVGQSGKGKSTLSAILASKGYELLADDVSPMDAKNKHIFYNPSAISTKEGAFNILRPLIQNFDSLPLTIFNKSKGPLRYIPVKNPKYDHYPCRAIIKVNFEKNSDTLLKHISVKEVLETLIPESWISPNPLHAKQFLNWLETIESYELTYSNTKSVTETIATLFAKYNTKA